MTKAQSEKADQTDKKPQADIIFDALFDAIFAQELLPGAKLSEETIAAVFGVSRDMVRGVLNRLHISSLIEFKPKRGAFVATPTLEEGRQIFEARMHIERAIAQQLARTITKKQLAELEEQVTLERKTFGSGEFSSFSRLSGDFHLRAARMTGNEVLTRILGELVTRCSLVLAAYGNRGTVDHGLEEHAEIIAELKKGDPNAAAAAMTAHLQHISDSALLNKKRRQERDLTDILIPYASAED